MAEFDPYLEWFGLKTDGVPDHYELIGVQRFESNVSVIEKAIESRVDFLQDVSSGEHTRESQELLGKVASARICLLDETKKKDYDRELANPVLTTPIIDTEKANQSSAKSQSDLFPPVIETEKTSAKSQSESSSQSQSDLFAAVTDHNSKEKFELNIDVGDKKDSQDANFQPVTVSKPSPQASPPKPAESQKPSKQNQDSSELVTANDGPPVGRDAQMKILVAAMILPSFFLAFGLVLYGLFAGESETATVKDNSTIIEPLKETTSINSASKKAVRQKLDKELVTSQFSKNTGAAKSKSTGKLANKKRNPNSKNKLVSTPFNPSSSKPKPKSNAKTKPKPKSKAKPNTKSKPAPVKTNYSATNPITKKLILWLDASDKSTIDLDSKNRVIRWRSKNSKTVVAVQNNEESRPNYLEKGNNRRALQFTGTQKMVFQNSADLNPAKLFSIFYVAKVSSGVILSKGSVADPVKPNGSFAIFGKHTKLPGLRTAKNDYFFPKSESPWQWKVRSIRKTEKTIFWLNNGEKKGSKRFSHTLANDQEFVLGQQKNGKWPLKGEVCEILVYEVSNSPVSLTKINGYLKRKWGIR